MPENWSGRFDLALLFGAVLNLRTQSIEAAAGISVTPAACQILGPAGRWITCAGSPEHSAGSVPLSTLNIALPGKLNMNRAATASQPIGVRVLLFRGRLGTSIDGQQIVLRVELEMKGVRRPIRWTRHESAKADDSLTIRLKGGNDADWKKGV